MLIDDGTDQLPTMHTVQVGLSDVAYDSTTDEQRKLVFVADHSRIKSYAWGSPSQNSRSGVNYAKPVPMHTLSSKGSNGAKGPLAIVNGRLLRSSKGFLSVWTLDNLETHVENGKALIGGKFDPADSWRDDPENIELSVGSAPDTRITFQNSALSPARWHSHPSNAGAMLCASEPRDPPPAYYCVTLDIETGKTIGRYLGHGGTIESFSTSAADPNVFVTGALDGYARLYDVRHPLPVLTLDVGYQSESCSSALITHPAGIPSTGYTWNQTLVG
jgi:WD40 repeat protein